MLLTEYNEVREIKKIEAEVEARGIINMCQEFDLSIQETIARLVEHLELTQEQASAEVKSMLM